jgi:hypothetical protein
MRGCLGEDVSMFEARRVYELDGLYCSAAHSLHCIAGGVVFGGWIELAGNPL